MNWVGNDKQYTSPSRERRRCMNLFALCTSLFEPIKLLLNNQLKKKCKCNINSLKLKTFKSNDLKGLFFSVGLTGPISNQYLEDLMDIQRLRYLITSNKL